MKYLFWLGFPALLVVGILQTVVELRSEMLSDQAFERITNFRTQLRAQTRSQALVPLSAGLMDRSSAPASLGSAVLPGPAEEDGRLRAFHLEETEVLQVARRASDAWMAEPRSHSTLASLLRHLAESRPETNRGSSETVKEQIALFCEALSTYGKALAADPLNARLLMSWANVRQLLGNTECGLALTQGQYSAAIVQALKLDPTDVESKYAAALLLLWGNATQPAWKLMSEVLRFNTEMSISQRRGIFSQVQSVQSLRAIVPARFPQIVSISEYLEANPISFGGDEGALTEFNVALAGLQRESIESSVEEYSRDLVPYSIHTDRLIRLSDLAVDDAVRQRLDRELSVLVRRRSLYALADYLAERSTLKELSVVFSSTGGDTRPAKSALVRWGSQDSFYLDEFYRTVGFYLSKGQAARGVEFSVSTLPTSALAPALKVFISDDNQNWSEITSQSSVRSFELGRQVLVTVRFPQREARYWKVHFSSANRERLVLGRLSGGGVKVFGTINGGAGKGDATAAAGSGEEVVSWRGL